MKDGSKRTISRLLAFVMLVSCMFTNVITAGATGGIFGNDDVESSTAVVAVDNMSASVNVGTEVSETDPYYLVTGTAKGDGVNQVTYDDATGLYLVEDSDTGATTTLYFPTNASGDKVEISGTFSPSTANNSWTLVQIWGVAEGGEAATEVAGIRTDGGNLKLRVEGTTLVDTGIATSANSTYNYKFVIDNASKTVTLDINGGVAEGTLANAYTSLSNVRFVTASGSRNVTVSAPSIVTGGSGDDTTVTETTTETTTSATEEDGPEAGKTYSADFSSLTVGDKLNGWSTSDGVISVISETDGAYVHDASHGAALVNGDQIKVAVAGNATVSLTLCQYGSGTEFVVTDSNGKVIDTIAGKAASDGEVVAVNYMGDATVLTFTLAAAGEAYLHGVTAANAAAPVGEAKSFEIWLDDMAVDGVVATDKYTGDVVLATGETVSLGDSILELQGKDTEQFTQSYSAAIGVVRDGKTVNGYKSGSRNANANDINPIPQQGDGCAIVFTPAATGTLNTYFVSTSFLRVWDFDTATGERYGYSDSEVAAESYGVKVEAGHTYVLSTTGKTNNMAYCGFEYVVDEPATISVSLNNIDANAGSIPNLEIYLTDAVLGGDSVATIKADTASVDLSKNHTYIMSTNDGGVKATVAGSDRFTATGEAIVIDLYDIPDVTLTGEITGVTEGVTGITFTNMINGTVYKATLTGNTYSVDLKPGDYDTAVEATNGAFTQDRVKVVTGEENVNEVYVEIVDSSKPATYGPADLFKLEHTDGVGARESDITAKPGDTITVPVAGAAVVTVSSYYQAAFTINGETYGSDSKSTSQIDSFTVNTAEGDTSLVITFTDSYNGTAVGTSYLTSISVVPVVEYKNEINVPGDYDTLNDAVAAIKGMTRPEGEEGRVTINLTADLEEQVVFDAPYVTLNGNGHTLSWYYGVGTFYYSIDKSTGLYSESLYRDKYSSVEADGNLWGGVAIIRGDNFIAKDTTFLNTYNYEVTEKEASDVEHSVASMPVRTLGADVTVYASKERSNAFYIDADNIEAYNCKILSSQDTLGRNGSANNNYHTYFKDCVIGGNTDYICGEFTAVFDNCELQWKTFANDDSNNSKVGYITAPKTSPYIFRNCTVTTSGLEGDGAVSGLYGRTWGANSQAYFINTETNGYITESGWGEMTSGDGASSLFYEYNNTSNGEAFVTNSAFSKVLEDAATISNMTSDNIITEYLNGWTPTSYSYEVVEDMWGDVDNSGTVDVIDVSLTLDYVLSPSSVKVFNKSVADVNGDGNINSTDVAMILQKVLDIDFKFPVETEEDTSEATTEDSTEETSETSSETATEDTSETTTGSEPVGTPTIYVVGDSTACHYGEDEDPYYWYKRVGFGDKLGNYFNENVTVVNLALSGRSSKSFATGINENGITDAAAVANYAQLKNDIKAGDYLIIAWGHNDEKTDSYRHTDPNGDINTAGSFKNSLYENYIKVAEDAGATPILCTPIIRANASGTLSDNDVHKPEAGDYGQCIRDLANELNITLIDNLTSTTDLYNEMSASVEGDKKGVSPSADVTINDDKTFVINSIVEPIGYFKLHAAVQSYDTDTTHLNDYGASMVAYMMARDIKASDNSLAAYVADGITAPVFSHDECYNTNWKPFDESEYVPSSIWKVSSPWAGSVFGSSVGSFTEDNHPNHDIAEQGENSVRLTASNNKGKIASNQDGLVMYFQEIEANQDFELTATAHINSYDSSNNQTGFGLMLRDNMFADYQYNTQAPYYAVGNTAQNSGKNKVSVFRRLTDGTLEQTVKVTNDFKPSDLFPEGTDVELKISRTGGVVTVQYGTEDPVTFTDSLCDLTKVSADKDYVGMFVSRAADVTFNNINLVIK